MKILFTGGGSGGHFYPLIAVAESINEIAKKENLIAPELFFMSDSPYDAELLIENNITFIPIFAGKIRRYASAKNIIDIFKTFFGVLTAIKKIFSLYPDVVFSKGAYASFPVLVAARLLNIPVIIHESDSIPGKTNKWASKFAKKIAVSYPNASDYFPKEKVAYTGNPIRKSVLYVNKADSHNYFNFENSIPTILIIGGSLGAKVINDIILDSLPNLIDKYQIIHQTGKNNISEVTKLSDIICGNNPNKNRYKIYDYLDGLNLTMAAGVADIVISRAGSAIFEIAGWGIPSIIIPITKSNDNHQRLNAYAYARSGSAVVIEEGNLTTNILVTEINRILQNNEIKNKMSEAAKNYNKKDASEKIAREIINIALSHEE
jgi:UDP-N-acetylglucosamine--N-acetylmuramyl-(pentapeptide) pyrophosphoryl-undecaprenol N-acetylglucosamine transferase